MNYFSGNKFWPVVVVLLIVVNTATLVFFWASGKKQPPFGMIENKGDAGAYLIKELQFDAAQQQVYNALREKHQSQSKTIRQLISRSKDSLYRLLESPAVTETQVVLYAHQAASAEGELDILTFHHFQQVRAICTGTQKTKFDSIIKNVIRMMGPGQRRPGPPPIHRRNANDSFPPPPDNDGPPLGPPPGEGERMPPPQ